VLEISLTAIRLRLDVVVHSKHHDQHRRIVEKRLLGIGAERRQGVKPFLRCAMLVEVTLEGRVSDDDEPPGLKICPGWRAEAATAIARSISTSGTGVVE
jgi:hypothetical protein